jgi:hypothetical protein
MKREWPRYQRITPVQFVSSGANCQLNFGRTFSRAGQRPNRGRKIFVIERTSRLPSTNEAGKKIRRILIYDNHPDSLRLVFGRAANRRVSVLPGVGSWELLIVSSLAIAGLIGIFWPLL